MRAALPVGIYLGVMTAVIYGVLDRETGATGVVLVFVVLANLLFGYLADGWWTLVLPFVLVPIAIPFGYPVEGELQVWVVVMYSAPLLAVLIGLGRAGRLLDDYLRRRSFRREDKR